jgi:PII-like signaling protein
MENFSEAKRLRIMISSTDKFRHSPLYEVLVFAAKRYGLAGASVTKGFMGYGSSSVIRTQKLWELTEKLPLIVEMVDDESKIDGFIGVLLPYFDKILKGGLITVEKVTIVLHKPGRGDQRLANRD